jgi:hypothetical protein
MPDVIHPHRVKDVGAVAGCLKGAIATSRHSLVFLPKIRTTPSSKSTSSHLILSSSEGPGGVPRFQLTSIRALFANAPPFGENHFSVVSVGGDLGCVSERLSSGVLLFFPGLGKAPDIFLRGGSPGHGGRGKVDCPWPHPTGGMQAASLYCLRRADSMGTERNLVFDATPLNSSQTSSFAAGFVVRVLSFLMVWCSVGWV